MEETQAFTFGFFMNREWRDPITKAHFDEDSVCLGVAGIAYEFLYVIGSEFLSIFDQPCALKLKALWMCQMFFVTKEDMKYFSSESGSVPIPSLNNGYWVRDEQIFDVTSTSHVRFMIENPSLFALTSNQIIEIYNKHREILGAEAKARDELVRYAASLGYCRVRRYTRPKEYWSIQTDSTKERRDTIVSFIRWGIENGIVQENDSAIILGFKDPWIDTCMNTRMAGSRGFYLKSSFMTTMFGTQFLLSLSYTWVLS